MKKSQALQLFGNSPSRLAVAARVSPSAISQWPDELTDLLEDRVIAACVREKLPVEDIERLLAGADGGPPVPATSEG